MGYKKNIVANGEIFRAYHQHTISDTHSISGQAVPPIAVSAQGATIITNSGRKIIDFASGHFGYSHPEILTRVADQFNSLALSSRVFFNRQLADFVEKVANLSADPLTVVYPCNSESEAIDGALKLARGFHNPQRHRIVAVEGLTAMSTLGSLSVSQKKRFQPQPDSPVEVTFIPYGDNHQAAAAINQSIAAVIIEPTGIFSGAAKINVDYLRFLSDLCRQSGALLITDETSTGLGHSGFLFSSDWSQIVPDILVLGRTLGGGVLPMAAYVTQWSVNDKVYGKRNPALHGSTTGGNPAACIAGTAVLEILEHHSLTEHLVELSEMLSVSLNILQKQYREQIVSYRVQGLIGRLDLREEQQIDLFRIRGLECGVLCTRQERQIFLQPPLIISPDEMTIGLQALENACQMFIRQTGSQQ